MPEYWIQIENRPWDVCPNNIDRMTGQNIKDRETTGTPGPDPVNATLVSPTEVPPVTTTVTMFKPLRDSGGKVTDALILRRYKPPQQPDQSDAWTVPDDRKINPWDLNEPDPTDSGTMGTIPGPVIECNLADPQGDNFVKVHFRNMDNRTQPGIQTICFPFPFIGQICIPLTVPVPIPIEKRTHSLHPHGFVFAPTSDGAYPLSPPDPTQPIPPSEAPAWASVGVTGQFKKGDRVPPGGTFIYTWNTFGWPTTAGVWLYHDHSICDMENVSQGAIGIIVIHNSNDPTDILAQDLPGGSVIGSPLDTICFPFPFGVRVLPHDLERLAASAGAAAGGPMPGMPGMGQARKPMAAVVEGANAMAGMRGGQKAKAGPPKGGKAMAMPPPRPGTDEVGPPDLTRVVRRRDLMLELDAELKFILRLCFSRYRTPPGKAVYLQLFHSLGDAGTCINGRKYLGNTPTVVAGPNTQMRFGVVGMGSEFHTFHIHGHRWILPGPHGSDPGTIQSSPQDTSVSQFEDTRMLGPANSFVFPINEGNGFFRADPFTPGGPVGEWHMHCHVLMHMGTGMMGSLLIVNGGELAFPAHGHDDSNLPVGVPCMPMVMPPTGPPLTATVRSTGDCLWKDDASGTSETTIKVNGTVTWKYDGCPPDHTVTSDNVAPFDTLTPALNLSPIPPDQSRVFTTVGNYGYHCNIHGGDPVTKTGMWGIVHVVP